MQNTTLDKIKEILSSVDDSIEDDAKIAMVKAFWEAGRLATDYKNSTGKLIREIASETLIPQWSLQRYMQCYRSFKNGCPETYYNRVITWSYICIVMSVHTAQARDFYLKQACKNNWNKYELKRRITQDFYTSEKKTNTSQKNTLKQSDQILYTYAAEVIKIIDADTLDLEIDVGFKLKQQHRVRLRGINCPEISSKQGKQAKKFVEKELEKCVIKQPLFKGAFAQRPVVIVQTHKQGIYGRYIVDIFYIPKENNTQTITKKGKLLNQVLIDKGHAVKI